jgi:DNA-directed RNA polymerase subunit RPC12/RpoP
MNNKPRWWHLADYIKYEDGSYACTACGKESPRCERTPNPKFVTCPRCLEVMKERVKSK